MLNFAGRKGRIKIGARRLPGLVGFSAGERVPVLDAIARRLGAAGIATSQVRSQAARGEGAPRRYVGRSGASGAGAVITGANPGAGAPLYGWATAAAMQDLGAGDWIGRVVSIIFSIAAGLVLFGIVRRTAGARAGLYALLFYAISPASVVLGQQISPASVIL